MIKSKKVRLNHDFSRHWSRAQSSKFLIKNKFESGDTILAADLLLTDFMQIRYSITFESNMSSPNNQIVHRKGCKI